MAAARVLTGALAPECLTLPVENASFEDEPLDLTTVTGWSLLVGMPDGFVTWSVTVDSVSADRAVLRHVFAQGDTDQIGTYKIMVLMTVPGGVRRAGPSTLQVYS